MDIRPLRLLRLRQTGGTTQKGSESGSMIFKRDPTISAGWTITQVPAAEGFPWNKKPKRREDVDEEHGEIGVPPHKEQEDTLAEENIPEAGQRIGKWRNLRRHQDRRLHPRQDMQSKILIPRLLRQQERQTGLRYHRLPS